MKIKEAIYLEEHACEIEVPDPRMVPIVKYLVKDNNYFRSTQELMKMTGLSRYLIKNAKDIIEMYIKDHVK